MQNGRMSFIANRMREQSELQNIHKMIAYLDCPPGTFSHDWYVHFASCFYIDIYCIMGCYYTLCHNTYAYSLLFYKVYIKRENAGS